MKLLLSITEQDIKADAPKVDTSVFRRREAARAVVLNDRGEVYLLNVTKRGYHKLPGGGIDDGEEIKEALTREIMEEIGCTANIGDEVGQIVEYRDFEKLKQTSYCYLAKQYGEQVEQSLEAGEIEEGHDIKIATDIDEAISILEKDIPNNHEGHFIRLRDLTLLKAAKSLLQA